MNTSLTGELPGASPDCNADPTPVNASNAAFTPTPILTMVLSVRAPDSVEPLLILSPASIAAFLSAGALGA